MRFVTWCHSNVFKIFWKINILIRNWIFSIDITHVLSCCLSNTYSSVFIFFQFLIYIFCMFISCNIFCIIFDYSSVWLCLWNIFYMWLNYWSENNSTCLSTENKLTVFSLRFLFGTFTSLHTVGYDIITLDTVGYDIITLDTVGYDIITLDTVGYDIITLDTVGYDIITLDTVGYDITLDTVGYDIITLFGCIV